MTNPRIQTETLHDHIHITIILIWAQKVGNEKVKWVAGWEKGVIMREKQKITALAHFLATSFLCTA